MRSSRGLAFLARWLRRRAPARDGALAARADDAGPDALRFLIFASGRRLLELAKDPEHAAAVRASIEAAVEALARAPKSISQSNAERLLARRVYGA